MLVITSTESDVVLQSSTPTLDEVRERLVRLLQNQTGGPKRVDSSTTVNGARWRNDFGIDGADAVELFEEIAKEFDITVEDFEFDRYFGPEVGDPFFPISLFLHILGWRAGAPQLKVDDLAKYVWLKVSGRQCNTP